MLPEPLPYAPVLLKLLQGPLYSDDRHWDQLQSYLSPVKEHFNGLGLQVQNYATEGFAFLTQPEPDPESKAEPLPRLTTRRQLSFKTTVFCVLLREQLLQFDASDATGRLVLNLDEIRDLLQPYLPMGNDETKFRREVDSLVRQAVELDFLKVLKNQADEYEVRPILKAKIDAEMLTQLRTKLASQTQKS